MGCVVMTGLADHQWRRRFSSSLESLLEGFYKPALMEATLSYLAGLWRSSVTAFYLLLARETMKSASLPMILSPQPYG